MITEVSDTQKAALLISKKMFNLELLGSDSALLDEEDTKGSPLHHLVNSFNLDGRDYRIFQTVFSEVIRSLEKKKIISIEAVSNQDVASYFHDPSLIYEFIGDCVKVNPSVNVKELLKDSVILFRVTDLKMLEREIEQLLRFTKRSTNANETNSQFDSQERILYLGEAKVVIAKLEPNNQSRLLETLFKNPRKEWLFDEIDEDWNPNDALKDKKASQSRNNRLYQTCREINRKISENTSVKNFLLYSKKSVEINEACL